jgi:ribosome biogenesis GTPase A
LVAGKSLTGKHAFITNLAKHVGKYNDTPYELNLIKIAPNVHLIDSPYKIEDNTGYPLFHIPNPILEESLFAQEENIIRNLFFSKAGNKQIFKHEVILEHFAIQDYTTIADFFAKVGKSWKLFGKGGNVDINRVRAKILSEWYNGKLNHLLYQ